MHSIPRVSASSNGGTAIAGDISCDLIDHLPSQCIGTLSVLASFLAICTNRFTHNFCLPECIRENKAAKQIEEASAAAAAKV
jgi:hypothetical protein